MDREMREEYLVVIQAKDMGGHMGGLSGTTTVTVTLTDINDNPPKFSKSKTSDLETPPVFLIFIEWRKRAIFPPYKVSSECLIEWVACYRKINAAKASSVDRGRPWEQTVYRSRQY